MSDETPILKYFKYEHLPPDLQGVSKPICELAREIVEKLPECEQRQLGLIALLQAKDFFVRSVV